MKSKKNDGKISPLRTDSKGKLSGGFGIIDQMKMKGLRGGIVPKNIACTNTTDCTGGTNEACGNDGICATK